MKTYSGEGEEKLIIPGRKIYYKAISLNTMVLAKEEAI